MSRCRETAGVLFKHQCEADAVVQCTRCRKPVCQLHQRGQGYGVTCVSCVRGSMKDPQQRSNMAYLRDDPYFFWYYAGDQWFHDPYGSDDYALFDSEQSAFGEGAETDWGGS